MNINTCLCVCMYVCLLRVPVLNLRWGQKGHIAPAAHDVAPSYNDLFVAYNEHTFIHT